MKKIGLVFTLLLSCTLIWAQTSTGTVPPDTSTHVVTTTTTGTNWLATHWGLLLSILLGMYELVARLVPTISNISILSAIMKVIAAIIPNNKATAPIVSNGNLSMKLSARKSKAASKLEKRFEAIE